MTRPLKFQQIEAFRAVMQAGTTTAAAALLNTTQPSVSRLLAQTAAATGLKLFESSRGRLLPTREAKALFEAVERNFQGLDRIEQRVAILRKSGAGMLRIGCTPALGVSLLPRVVARFCQAHPHVHLSLQTVGTHALREGLSHGAWDVALSTTARTGAGAGKVLHKASLVCVVQASHPLAGRGRLHVRDLAGQRLLTLNAEDETQGQLRRLLHSHGIEPAATVETTYSVTICRLAAEGAGVGVVNPYVADLFRPGLHVAPLAPRCPVEVVLALPQQSAPSAAVDAFTRMVRDELDAMPPR